jgi:murein DD-endopeptidase MepM/ murein hydrolase activator NlpD
MSQAAPAVLTVLPRLVQAWLSAHASVVFGESRVAGLLCLLATAIYPRVLLGGLGALLLVEAAFALLALPEISRPAARLNALLAGLAIAALWSPEVVGNAWWLAYPLAVLLAVGLSLWLGELLWQAGQLPALSLPFSLSIWAVMPILGSLSPEIPALPAFITTDSLAATLLTAAGWIFLSPHPLSGLLVLVALLISSRWLFLLAVAGYAVGQLAMFVLAPYAMGPGYAFNYPLAAMAVGGFYCRPGLGSFVLALLAAALAALGSAAFAHGFGESGMLTLSVPFVAATLLVLATVRHARRGVVATLSYPAPPERQAETARLARARLGAPGSLPLTPPFHGEWQVYQGVDGAHTHRGPWRHALDFFIAEEGKSYRNDGAQLSDYLCFGLPVLAPIAGEVVVVRDGLPDNPPGHADTKENWGNHVVIRAADGSHAWLAHLRQGSVSVTAGNWVRAGDALGTCGNSGRSPQPHLHVHVQAGIAAGAATLPFHLDNVLRRAVSPAPTFPRRRGDELEWRLACVPDQGDRVQAARTDAILAGALALPVGRRLGFEVREGASVPRLWMVETTLTLAGQLRLTGERASLAAVSGPRAFALYERQGHADPWLDLFALALGLTPLAEAQDWSDGPPARLFPASFAARVALWLGRPLGCALSSRYHRERLAVPDIWRQHGRHELQVAPGWREVFETEADIAPSGGVVRILGLRAARVMEMRLTTLAQTPDEGIPAWQVEVAAHSAQIATDRSSTALPLFRSWPA